jgi:alpha-amylase
MKLMNKKTLLAFLMMAGFSAPLAVQAAPNTVSPNKVYVNLFEWRYTDIEKECKDFLGPKGFGAVQVSVPSEAIANNGRWYERYQPVSYKLDSRLGTRTDLANMVATCRGEGVAIYFDVVLNHMAAEPGDGKGESGSAYTPAISYSGPGYTAGDFHGACDVTDSSALNVHDCRISHLPDLATGKPNVRTTLGNYLKDLLNLGAAGFRLDAAKHMPADDLKIILANAGGLNLNTARDFPDLKNLPWITEEDAGGFGPITQDEIDKYFSLGTANEFHYKDVLRDKFDYHATGQGLADLRGILPVNETENNPGHMFASRKATVFVCNHDGERRNACMNRDYGPMFNLANVFMLAYPYGQPQLQSGFLIPGPPGDGPGQKASVPIPGTPVYNSPTATPDGTKWDLQHRLPEIANMVAFRNETENYKKVDDWFVDPSNKNRVAFHRGDRGFIAINRDDDSAWSPTNVKTGMAPGQYCNVINGQLNATRTGCVDQNNNPTDVITVKSDGTVDLNLKKLGDAPPLPAVAIHAGQQINSACGSVPVTFTVSNANTVFGQNVYVAGDDANIVGKRQELGPWKPTDDNALNIQGSGANATWTRTLRLPPSTAIKYKFMKSGAVADVWESGADRTVTTQACGEASAVPAVNFRF